jgi:hypothetical protein
VTTPLKQFHVRILYGASVIKAQLAEDPSTGQPMFRRATAAPLQPTINTQQDISNASTPPEQGYNQTLEDVSGGAGAYNYTPGRYAFGASVETATGAVYPGPLVVRDTLSGGGALDGPIWAVTRYGDKDYIAAGKKVYYWDYTAGTPLWVKTATDPTAGAATKITDIINFEDILFVCFDTVADYQYSEDGGATWVAPSGAGQKRFKHFAIREQRSTRPIMVGINDPDAFYELAAPYDPRDSESWDTGSLIGSGGNANADHFTSVTAAPGGDLLMGKRLGWRTMDSFGNVDIMFPAPTARGLGLENFAWPAQVGSALYVQVRDYDLLEWQQGTVRVIPSPRTAGPRVPEMRKAIVALAGDGTEWLYCALEGTAGHVMRGRYQGDRWVWHGAYVATGERINNRIWMTSHPLGSDTNNYLVMSAKATPYLPYRALIPSAPLEDDTDARFAASGYVRFGYANAGQDQVTKVLAQAFPVSRNLASGDATITLAYRTDNATSFTNLATFDDSPQPTDMTDTYFPAGTSCKRWELKATLTAATSTDLPILDQVNVRAYRRPQRTHTWQMTVLAETGIAQMGGQPSRLSAKGLQTALYAALQTIVPPTIVNEFDGSTYTVDIQDIAETYVQYDRGKGSASPNRAPALAFTLTLLELPTLTSFASSSDGVPHTHTMDSFTGDNSDTTFVLSNTPIGPVLVYVDDAYKVEGTGEDFTRSGTTITFTSAPALNAAIRVLYPY